MGTPVYSHLIYLFGTPYTDSNAMSVLAAERPRQTTCVAHVGIHSLDLLGVPHAWQ